MSTRIRPIRSTDVYRLHQLDRTPDAPCWINEIETWVMRDAWHWYRDPSTPSPTLLIAEHLGELAGCAAASHLSAARWYIPAIYVESSHQRQGIGTALLSTLLEELTGTGAPTEAAERHTIEWVVHHANDPMHALSARVGATRFDTVALHCDGREEAEYTRWLITP